MPSNFVQTQPIRSQCNGHLPDKYELFPVDAVIKEKSNELTGLLAPSIDTNSSVIIK